MLALGNFTNYLTSFRWAINNVLLLFLLLSHRYESKCVTYWEYVLARVDAPTSARGYVEDYISVAVSCNCVIRARVHEEPLHQIVYGSK